MSQFFTPTRRQALGVIGAAALSGAAGGFPPRPALAKAPMLGAPNSTFRRFKLGGYEVTIIRDGAISVAGPYPAFGADQFEEDVHALMEENHLPPSRFELPYSPVLVNTGAELILFDTGNDAARRPERGHLQEGLALAGYTPDQIDVVALTHLHPDHIGGMIEDGAAMFPNARYVCGEVEFDFWRREDLLTRDAGMVRRAKAVHENVAPLAEQIAFLKDESEVAPGIRAIDAPGHTPGHLAYHVESEGQRLLIWGDAIVHHVISFQQPDWPMAADMDDEQAIASRRKLLGMAAADKIAVAGYHLPFPAFGFVEQTEEAFRFVPASYQFNI